MKILAFYGNRKFIALFKITHHQTYPKLNKSSAYIQIELF
jgi:hypothetical protein